MNDLRKEHIDNGDISDEINFDGK